jgi:hypothetical protein
LLQICDVFEALTAARPYKPQLSPHAAFGIMLEDMAAFQPSLLASFIGAVGIYPPGNAVVLSDGSHGTVASVGPLIHRPIIEITRDASGRELSAGDVLQIDLSAEQYSRLSVVDILL